MKNILTTISLVALFLLASCSKEDDNKSSNYPRTCTCKTVTKGPDGSIVSTVSTTVEIYEGNCSEGNSSVNANGASIVTTCN